MANDAVQPIIFFAAVDAISEIGLFKMRHWPLVLGARDGVRFWLKGLTPDQINSVEMRTLSHVAIFYSRNGQLYKMNSLLPDQPEPMLDWQPLHRLFPVTLPKSNAYLREIPEITVRLIPENREHSAAALQTSAAILKRYVTGAPTVRLENLQWVLLENGEVLVIGSPILPINGTAYWRDGAHFLPAGFYFELPILKEIIQSKLDETREKYLFWREDGTCLPISPESFTPLTLGSFRKTAQLHAWINQ